MLADSTRVHQIDKWVDADVPKSTFVNHLFVRLVAKKKKFVEVDFTYSIFDACYLRDCVFDSCIFIGCRFIATNLHGATFSGCKFDYATFERTTIDSTVLDTECPGPENLKMRFARSLRMNYQQLGDAAAVNKAMRVELRASEIHLRKAWQSNESYYRKKYPGLKQVKVFFEWVRFKVLDLIWGNGESALKLLRAVFVLLVIMALVDTLEFRDPGLLRSYTHAFLQAPQILLGTVSPRYYPSWYLTLIVLLRLVAFGFFMSIITKRFSRR